MPGPKAKIPAPIDRPLSRAYLREFSGWSTAYPPGLSDPTSLRIMENVQVNRDGSARVRPGLRYLSYTTLPVDGVGGVGLDVDPVGTHEAFFLADGTKAYLFAVREADSSVGFRVLALSGSGSVVRHLTDAGVDFSVPQGEPVLNFSSATTYVKYLQIDNKVFALSNAGESMRLFTVGSNKTAKKLSSVERPDWSVADKLTVVQPDAPWLTSSVPTAVRKNLVPNPGFETNANRWYPDPRTKVTRVGPASGHTGGVALQLETIAERTNLAENPSFATSVQPLYGNPDLGWGVSHQAGVGRVNAGYAKVDYDNPLNNTSDSLLIFKDNAFGRFAVTPGQNYTASVYLRQTYGEAISPNPGTLNRPVQVLLEMRFYDSAGNWLSSSGGPEITTVLGSWHRLTNAGVPAPAGAASMVLALAFRPVLADNYIPKLSLDVDDILVEKGSTVGAYFDGASGADYSWLGGVNASQSVYDPPVNATIFSDAMTVTAALDYVASAYFKAVSTVRNCQVGIIYYDSGGAVLSTNPFNADDVVGAWTRLYKVQAAPAGAVSAAVWLRVITPPRGEAHWVDSVMLEQASAVGTYFDGDTADTATVIRSWDGSPSNGSSTETTYSVGGTIPAAETPTANTLVSSSAAANTYNFGYFYTFSNEIGESAASQATVIRAQRRWSAWKWETANAVGEPSGTLTSDPALCADQLVASMPSAVYAAAKAQGATSWNLYMLTWSDQDSAPVEGILLGSKSITPTGTHGAEGWIRHTPQNTDSGYSALVPQLGNRYNYSVPSKAAQGLVASDRMILVDDPSAPAVIRWSSNQQGEYTNFTAAKGGGYKTLTSGNLYVPAAVKLWQNPQSVDTLTILCMGVDGQNTGYYMAPATVSSQSEQTTIMGFEETTATPGTVSPYGCEVLNNALYHPLDTELMKSTASNYNINHKSMTEQIDNRWTRLANKHRIVSSQHDNRLYYIVHNPEGAALEPGCMGNEVWVFDAGATAGTWSRWLIQASSLRRIEYAGKVYMSVIRPDGIYYLDPYYDRDDVVGAGNAIGSRFIPWRIETNTQGANRAHDAWAHLQQLTLSLGNFGGSIEYGIRSWDIHGKNVDVSKVVRDLNPGSADGLPYDIDDHLKVQRDLKEWFLYAGSVLDEDGAVVRSTGQINVVQYRYTPVSVNVGYEYGEVETFEYGRALVNWADRTTDNGIPQPMLETRRP